MSDTSETDSDTTEQVQPRNVKDAQKILEDIRFRHGHIDARDDDELSKTSPKFQRKSRRRAKNERQTLAQFTKLVSEKIYSTDFRFIYEMIQNADDASYTDALKAGRTPFLTFRIRSNELIVDSNQDDFEVANVQAICATGKSSKKDHSDTIGEMGLGFKSVFGVASQVHIQSGLWSFEFKHRKNEDGLGMITPWWTDPNPLPGDVKTRFKLKYTEKDKNMREKLIAEFANLPETVIIFLRTVQELRIFWDDVDDKKKKRKKIIRKESKLKDQEVSILTECDGDKGEYQYRVVTQNIPNLPHDDRRQGGDTRKVSLAFPVDESGQPIISERGQHVFAFLPLQRLPQIPFLIQADFITSASRESLPECPWNVALRSGVATTFRQAIEEFCEEGKDLLYTWMRYLPTSRIEAFWEPLYSEIKMLLTNCKILDPMSDRRLRLPSELRVLPMEFLHDDDPLFEDLEEDIYLCDSYEDADIELLEDLGLHKMSWDQMLDRLEADLGSQDSRMKSTELEDAWHTAVTELIEKALEDDEDRPGLRDRILDLEILPLQSREWTSPSTATVTDPIYFPNLDEDLQSLLIPQDLGLRSIHPKACVLPERKTVYQSLGISDCAGRVLVDEILRIHRRNSCGDLANTLSHFEILFWFGPQLTSTQRGDLRALTENSRVQRSSTLFFRSDKDCHTEELLQFTNINDVEDCGFIHNEYLSSKVKGQYRYKKTWEGWLESVAGVRYYPHLNDMQNPSSLSPVLEAVLRDNSSQFVPTLQVHWTSSYKAVCDDFPDLKSKIRRCKVLCRNEKLEQLQKTFLPTKELLCESHQFGVKSRLPILELGSGKNAADGEHWSFLQEFGVCCELNLTFYLKVLFALQTQAKGQECNHKAVVDVYKSIGRILDLRSKARLQEFFTTKKAIYVPGATRSWNAPDDCLWDGPHFLREKLLLKIHYSHYEEASSLFTNYLNVCDATYEHVLAELASIRKRSLPENSRSISTPPKTQVLAEMYDTLHRMVDSEEKWGIVRDHFERESLVLASGNWYKPSSCIWNCTVNISGRPTVDSSYPNLENFFVKHLKVKIANTGWLIQQLIVLVKQGATKFSELKNIMIAVGTMLGQEQMPSTLEGSLNKLKEYKFLPVRSSTGDRFFEKTTASFFINDHERFGLAFKGKLNFLDFSYDELTSLHPLFHSLELEHRYLSRHIKSETTIGTSVKNQLLATEFSQRSYALSCCAVFHQSRRFRNHNEEVHKMLMNARVFVSSDIRTNLVVKQGSTVVESISDRVLIKVEERDHRLVLYLPRDAASFQSCYRSQLPAQLMQTLGIANSGAEKQIYRLLTEDTLQLENIMVDEDIPHVSWLEKPYIPAKIEDNLHDAYATATLTATRIYVSSLAVGWAPEPPIEKLQPRTHTVEYRQLLERVIRQAQQIPGKEKDRSAFSMTPLGEALDEGPLPSDIRQILGLQRGQAMTFEDNAKIGAAGELFVFERLRALGIPNFKISNWQSTIRDRVKVVPQHKDLERWSGREVADIMYRDRTDEMEKFLRKHSFKKFPEWSDLPSDDEEREKTYSDGDSEITSSDEDDGKHHKQKPIEYQLEVKTTVDVCDTTFFLSKNQYKRMKRNALQTGRRPRKVYIIFRVFNLLRKDIDMKIFVDPWSLRPDTLRIFTDEWKVSSRTG